MKNKKNIYFLLPAVLIIWGLLGYRVFSAVQPEQTTAHLAVAEVAFNPDEFKDTEPFTIKANYRDPFLGSTKVKKPRVRPKAKTQNKAVKPFPKVVYKGVVSGNNKNQVFIIIIEGKRYFFKKYQTQHGLKLLNGNSKSVVLKFENQQQTFFLSK